MLDTRNILGIVAAIVCFLILVYFFVLFKVGQSLIDNPPKYGGKHTLKGGNIGRSLDTFFNNPFFNFILPLIVIGALIYGLYLAAKNHLI